MSILLSGITVVMATLVSGFLVDEQMQTWVTTGDGSRKLSQGSSLSRNSGNIDGFHVWVDRTKRRQTMEGFGAALTNAAAYNLYNSHQCYTIMDQLFSPHGIGISYIRLAMGGSDFQAVNPYTYDDISPYDTDFNLDHFSIDQDRAFVIPILKQAISTNPNLKIVATPWSAPAWMKTSHKLFGGEMNSDQQYLNTYAHYFLKFVQAYAAEGIHISAVTLQNEPQLSRDSYPTMTMSWQTQQTFIRDHVGPLFKQNNIQTKILIYDHNWSGADYADHVLSDSRVQQYVGGVAWHGYEGRHDAPSGFHDRHPNVDIYFTEITGGDWDTNFDSILRWNMRLIVIGQTRAWAKAVLFFNLALDENHGPRVGVHGCDNCRGVVTIQRNGNYRKEPEYYIIGHVSKFVKPGAVRIESASFGWDDLQTVAFQNPDGSAVIVVQNPHSSNSATFTVDIDAKRFTYSNLLPGSVVTLVFPHQS